MELLPLPANAPPALLLGFSGGRDSTALLHRLASDPLMRTRLRAMHVDHGMQDGSAAWSRHCAQVAKDLGVPFLSVRVSVRQSGRGPEAAAREARWAALMVERQSNETLVLAQHRDDQAETLLLALLRGSGERGLSAMRPFVHDARGPVWRPLLDTAGEAVQRYAEAHALRWIEDPSNRDASLSRNALRADVLPLLRQRWPQASAGLARSATLLAEADALLRTQAESDLAVLQGLDPHTVNVDALRALPPARGSRALRQWVSSLGGSLSTDAVHRVLNDWACMPRTRALRHPVGGHWLRQWGGRLWLTPREARHAPALDATPDLPPDAAPLVWDGRGPVVLPDASTMRLLGAKALPHPLRLVPRCAAPRRFRPDTERPARSLQQTFAALGVPPWAREALPLWVDANDELAALADLAYSATFDQWLQDHGARLIWQPAPARG